MYEEVHITKEAKARLKGYSTIEEKDTRFTEKESIVNLKRKCEKDAFCICISM